MRKTIQQNLCLAVFLLAGFAAQPYAVTQDNFLARDTNDIIELCSAQADDPLYTAAVHFCHGYAEFIAWAKSHPEYGRERAVNTMFKYLIERWPCK